MTGITGFNTISLVYISEICGPSLRVIGIATIVIFSSLGVLIMTLLHHFHPNFIFISLGITSIISLIILYKQKYFYESPQFLSTSHKFSESLIVLQKIAKFNNKEFNTLTEIDT